MPWGLTSRADTVQRFRRFLAESRLYDRLVRLRCHQKIFQTKNPERFARVTAGVVCENGEKRCHSLNCELFLWKTVSQLEL